MARTAIYVVRHQSKAKCPMLRTCQEACGTDRFHLPPSPIVKYIKVGRAVVRNLRAAPNTSVVAFERNVESWRSWEQTDGLFIFYNLAETGGFFLNRRVQVRLTAAPPSRLHDECYRD